MVELLCAHDKDVVWDAANAFSMAMRFFCVGRTQWVVLSAAVTQNRMRNACEAPKRRPQQALTAVSAARRRHIAPELRK